MKRDYKFIGINRSFIGAHFLVQYKDGEFWLLEEADDYYEEAVNDPFDIDGTEYFWTEWAGEGETTDIEMFEDIWINGDDTGSTLTYFDNFEDAKTWRFAE